MLGSEIGITGITNEPTLIDAVVVIGFTLLSWFMIQFISYKLSSLK
jgi:hypothetical protein